MPRRSLPALVAQGIVSPLRSCSLRDYWLAALLTAPALIAALLMQWPAEFSELLLTGGWTALRVNLCLTALFPYFGVFLLALGTLLLPPPPRMQVRLPSSDADVELTRFFAGTGTLVVVGFLLGAAQLLRPWITIPIFVGVIFLYFARSRDLLAHVGNWLRVKDASDISLGSTDRAKGVWRLTALIRWASVAVVGYVLLTKGIVVNLISSDLMQLYFPYMAEVRLQHGIWLDPHHPVFSDFLIGRGNGGYLYFTNFTNPYATQIVSAVFFVALAITVSRIVRSLVPRPLVRSSWDTVRLVFPSCAMLLAISSPIMGIELGKYHLHTAAILVFFGWSAARVVLLYQDEARWQLRGLLPLAAAIPIMLPAYWAFATAYLTITAGVALVCRRRNLLPRFALLMIVGCVATAGSLALNQLYIGIAGMNPYFLFVRFLDAERLAQWTSVDSIVYLNLTQDVKVMPWEHLWNQLMAPMPGSVWIKQASRFLRLCLPIGAFFAITYRRRAFLHIFTVIAIPAGVALFLGQMGLPNDARWSPMLRLGLEALLHGWVAPAQILQFDVFLLLFYATVITYLIVYFIGYLPVFLKGRQYWWPLPRPRLRITAIIAAIGLFYLVGWSCVKLVNQGSLVRLFVFQHVYEIVGMFVLAVGFLLLVRRLANWTKSVPEPRWNWSAVAVGAGLATYLAHRLIEKTFYMNLDDLIYLPVLAVAAGLSTALVWDLQRKQVDAGPRAPFVQRTCVVIGSLTTVFAAVGCLWDHRRHSDEVDGPVLVKAAQYFVGDIGLDDCKQDRWDFQRCLEIASAVPGDAPVLALNAYQDIVPCHNSPLLPRNKLVHHYQSQLARHYRDVLAESPQNAYATFKRLRIDHFYVQKENFNFYGPGHTEAFDAEHLQKNFDVEYEGDSFYLLTWRGRGLRPVDASLADYIESMRQFGAVCPPHHYYAQAVRRYRTWVATDGVASDDPQAKALAKAIAAPPREVFLFGLQPGEVFIYHGYTFVYRGDRAYESIDGPGGGPWRTLFNHSVDRIDRTTRLPVKDRSKRR